MEAITREERLMDGQYVEPITREEKILAGEDLETVTRREYFLKKYRGGGGDISVVQLSVTENGVYTAPSGMAYSPVNVEVPTPENAYFLKSVAGLPSDIASFSDGASMPLKNLEVSIEPVQSGSGEPSPSNVRPISGWTECNVTDCGVNICGGKYMADNIKDNIDSAVIDETAKTVSFGYSSGSATADIITAFKTKENTPYTFIFTILNPTTNRTNLCILYTDGTTSSISMTKTNEKETVVYTSASNKTVKSVNLQRQGGTTYIYYDESGIFEGTITTSDFVPYNGSVTNIAFTDGTNPLTVYGGTLDVVNGVLTMDYIKELFDGSEDELWNAYTSSNGFTISKSAMKSGNAQSGLANWLKTITNNSEFGIRFGGNNTLIYCNHITDNISGISDVTSWRTYLSNHELEIMFPLATPQTYQLTPTAVASILGVNNVWADTGSVNEVQYLSREV